MTLYMIALTITIFRGMNHDHSHCFLYTQVGNSHESKTIDIDTANKIMWELKRKGWETKTTERYISSRIFEREIRWIHIDNGYRED